MPKAINTAVTGRADWELASFDVLTMEGLRSVNGIACGFFAIHQGRFSWTLTHLPTGVRISSADDLLPLVCLAAKLKPLLDWDFTETEAWMRQDRKSVSAAITECGADIPFANQGWDEKLKEAAA